VAGAAFDPDLPREVAMRCPVAGSIICSRHTQEILGMQPISQACPKGARNRIAPWRRALGAGEGLFWARSQAMTVVDHHIACILQLWRRSERR